MCICMSCVCVCKREREREGGGGWGEDLKKGRKRKKGYKLECGGSAGDRKRLVSGQTIKDPLGGIVRAAL
jgi:hypothetical protein